MYQMTHFIKKGIYKNNKVCKRYQIAPFLSNFIGVACPQTPLAKGMASLSCGYMQRDALTHANLPFRKKILTHYQILYWPTLLTYMYK